MSDNIPDGYDKTGRTVYGHVVCCLSKYFFQFTGGLDTDHLGFAVVDGDLVPLPEYRKQFPKIA